MWNLDAGDSAAQVVVAEFGIAWRTFTDGDWSEFDYTASTIDAAMLSAEDSMTVVTAARCPACDRDYCNRWLWSRRADRDPKMPTPAHVDECAEHADAARAVPADVEDAVSKATNAATAAGRIYETGSTSDCVAAADEASHWSRALKATIARAIAEARQPATVGGLLATAPVGSIVENPPAFRVAEYGEPTGYDEDKSVLLGPDGWDCYLGEPEDRTWGRDGRPAVDMLNEQAAEVRDLRAKLAESTTLLRSASGLFIAIQVTDGEEEHHAICAGAELAAKIAAALKSL